MHEKLTVVIPFLNEEDEVGKTLKNITDTSTSDDLDIILVNDGSEISTLEFKNTTIIKNDQKLGTSISREKGILLSENQYVLTIDAHMRFKNKGWDKIIIEKIKENINSILCFSCPNVESKDVYYAGGLHLFPMFNTDLMLTPFLLNIEPKEEISDIPCVVGGAYAFYLPWYKHLRGMSGMKGWGVGETFLSLKSWLAGGSCKICKNIKIGHIFKTQNYVIDKSLLHYNKMRLCKTILPFKFNSYPMWFLKNSPEKEKAMKYFINDLKEIMEDKIQYENILHYDFEDFIKKFKLDFPQ